MSEISVQPLLETAAVRISDVRCRGSCRHKSAEECASRNYLVFPYRGVFVRHLGGDDAVAEASQVLFFNADEGYRVSHPVTGGDAALNLYLEQELLAELAPGPAFRTQRLRIDARAQALVSLLRHSLNRGIAEKLEAESLALTLVRRSLGSHAARVPGAKVSTGQRRLVNRIKLALATDLSRRWTLADIAAEIGGSAVYLTQVFQRVEGVPLYRYQLGLRLARALDLLAHYEDLGALGLDLGFSSHSHFSAAFQRTYGRSPSQFRQSALRRPATPAGH